MFCKYEGIFHIIIIIFILVLFILNYALRCVLGLMGISLKLQDNVLAENYRFMFYFRFL